MSRTDQRGDPLNHTEASVRQGGEPENRHSLNVPPWKGTLAIHGCPNLKEREKKGNTLYSKESGNKNNEPHRARLAVLAGNLNRKGNQKPHRFQKKKRARGKSGRSQTETMGGEGGKCLDVNDIGPGGNALSRSGGPGGLKPAAN